MLKKSALVENVKVCLKRFGERLGGEEVGFRNLGDHTGIVKIAVDSGIGLKGVRSTKPPKKDERAEYAVRLGSV